MGVSQLSLAELEKLFKTRTSVVETLYTRRKKIEQKIGGINQRIAELEGAKSQGRVARPTGYKRRPPAWKTREQNTMSLKQAVMEVLLANPKGLKTSEIVELVPGTGYVTNSENFYNVVYQCVYHDDVKFVSNGGIYTLTKAGTKIAKANAKAKAEARTDFDNRH